jgi:hypothetical protein
MFPAFCPMNEFLGSDGIIPNEVVEAIGVDFPKCSLIDQPLLKHDLTVFEETHVSLDFGPFFSGGRSASVCPLPSRPEATVYHIMPGEPVPEVKPESGAVCSKSHSGVIGGDSKRYYRDQNAANGDNILDV